MQDDLACLRHFEPKQDRQVGDITSRLDMYITLEAEEPLIQLVNHLELELMECQETNAADHRVCTADAVLAGRAHRPADVQAHDAIWQDICDLPSAARRTV